MRIGINDHIDGTERTVGAAGGAGPDPIDAARAAGARAWAQTDARLERVRSRLDQPRRVLVRDFIIFELKLLLDGLKGLIISQVAIAAFVLDMVRPGGRDHRVFYRVMDVGERMDRWLSLYGATRHAAEDPEGLMGESQEGSPTMLGTLEHIVHRVVVGDHPPEGELYPRSRMTPEPEPATGQTAGSGANRPAGQPGGPASGTGTGAGATTDSSSRTSTGPQQPGGPSRPASAPPSPEPQRRSSFETENYGRRGDA